MATVASVLGPHGPETSGPVQAVQVLEFRERVAALRKVVEGQLLAFDRWRTEDSREAPRERRREPHHEQGHEAHRKRGHAHHEQLQQHSHHKHGEDDEHRRQHHEPAHAEVSRVAHNAATDHDVAAEKRVLRQELAVVEAKALMLSQELQAAAARQLRQETEKLGLKAELEAARHMLQHHAQAFHTAAASEELARRAEEAEDRALELARRVGELTAQLEEQEQQLRATSSALVQELLQRGEAAEARVQELARTVEEMSSSAIRQAGRERAARDTALRAATALADQSESPALGRLALSGWRSAVLESRLSRAVEARKAAVTRAVAAFCTDRPDSSVQQLVLRLWYQDAMKGRMSRALEAAHRERDALSERAAQAEARFGAAMARADQMSQVREEQLRRALEHELQAQRDVLQTELAQRAEAERKAMRAEFNHRADAVASRKLSQQELQVLQQRLVAAEARAQAAEAKRWELQEQLTATRQSLAEQQAGLQDLERQRHALEGALEDARSQLQADPLSPSRLDLSAQETIVRLSQENGTLKGQLAQTWAQIKEQTKRLEAERSAFRQELDQVRQSAELQRAAASPAALPPAAPMQFSPPSVPPSQPALPARFSSPARLRPILATELNVLEASYRQAGSPFPRGALSAEAVGQAGPQSPTVLSARGGRPSFGAAYAQQAVQQAVQQTVQQVVAAPQASLRPLSYSRVTVQPQVANLAPGYQLAAPPMRQ